MIILYAYSRLFMTIFEYSKTASGFSFSHAEVKYIYYTLAWAWIEGNIGDQPYWCKFCILRIWRPHERGQARGGQASVGRGIPKLAQNTKKAQNGPKMVEND